MNSNWKYSVALCLIAAYVIGINCADDKKDEITYKFLANETIKGENDTYQVQCSPNDLCKKVKFKVVNCTGNYSHCCHFVTNQSQIHHNVIENQRMS